MTSLRALALAAGLALLASPVLADSAFNSGSGMPLLAFAPTSAFTWSGFYTGYYAGGDFGEAKPKDDTGHVDFNAFTTGVFGGVNYQVGSVVFGAETEIGLNNFSKSQSSTGTYHDATAGDLPATFTNEESQSYEGRVRARLGFALNNVLLFAAGGWTYGDAKATYSRNVTDSTLVTSGTSTGSNSGGAAGLGSLTIGEADSMTSSQTKMISGWNIGGGVDYALTNNWTIRGEYIYDQFPSVKYVFNGVASPKVEINENTFRMAIGYRF
jgi:outer membrane immunogenic protein